MLSTNCQSFACNQVETYKNLCSGAARDVQTDLMHSDDWKELQTQCAQQVVPDVQARMMEMMGQAVKGLPQIDDTCTVRHSYKHQLQWLWPIGCAASCLHACHFIECVMRTHSLFS